MNVDSIFIKGNSHLVCEDYAIADKIDDNTAYLIVADGCSSGFRSDVASRMLALIIEKLINENIDLCRSLSSNSIANFIVRNLPIYFYNIFSLHRLVSPNDMLSTIVIAIICDGQAKVISFGDSVIALRYKNGSTLTRSISFEDEAPRYLAYSFNATMSKDYKDIYGDQKVIRRTDKTIEQTYLAKDDDEVLNGFPTAFDISNLSSLIISSDGIGSIVRSDGSVIDSHDSILEASSFVNTNGEFLRRRIHRMQLDIEKAGSHHYDDLGFAAVAF